MLKFNVTVVYFLAVGTWAVGLGDWDHFKRSIYFGVVSALEIIHKLFIFWNNWI